MEKKHEFPSAAGSLPRWLQPLWLGQNKARSPDLLVSYVVANAQLRGLFSTAFAGALTGDWIRSRAAWSQSSISVGCWSHRVRLNVLFCRAGPSDFFKSNNPFLSKSFLASCYIAFSSLLTSFFWILISPFLQWFGWALWFHVLFQFSSS